MSPIHFLVGFSVLLSLTNGQVLSLNNQPSTPNTAYPIIGNYSLLIPAGYNLSVNARGNWAEVKLGCLVMNMSFNAYVNKSFEVLNFKPVGKKNSSCLDDNARLSLLLGGGDVNEFSQNGPDLTLFSKNLTFKVVLRKSLLITEDLVGQWVISQSTPTSTDCTVISFAKSSAYISDGCNTYLLTYRSYSDRSLVIQTIFRMDFNYSCASDSNRIIQLMKSATRFHYYTSTTVGLYNFAREYVLTLTMLEYDQAVYNIVSQSLSISGSTVGFNPVLDDWLSDQQTFGSAQQPPLPAQFDQQNKQNNSCLPVAYMSTRLNLVELSYCSRKPIVFSMKTTCLSILASSIPVERLKKFNSVNAAFREVMTLEKRSEQEVEQSTPIYEIKMPNGVKIAVA